MILGTRHTMHYLADIIVGALSIIGHSRRQPNSGQCIHDHISEMKFYTLKELETMITAFRREPGTLILTALQLRQKWQHRSFIPGDQKDHYITNMVNAERVFIQHIDHDTDAQPDLQFMKDFLMFLVTMHFRLENIMHHHQRQLRDIETVNTAYRRAIAGGL